MLFNLVTTKQKVLTWGLEQTRDLHVIAGQTLTLSVPQPGEQQQIYQYITITVDAGGSLTAFYNPLVLQATESIIINGTINMDGKGGLGTISNSHDGFTQQSGALAAAGPVYQPTTDNGSANLVTWNYVANVVHTAKRLDLSFNLTGGGASNRYSWTSWTKTRTRSHRVYGCANSPVPSSNDRQSGAAGGCLILLYNTLVYSGATYTLNVVQYPLAIHANGATNNTGYHQWKDGNNGGGQLMLAAPYIEVGSSGRVSCDGATDCNGYMALLNLPDNVSNTRYTFNNGVPSTTSANQYTAGAGICIGVDINS